MQKRFYGIVLFGLLMAIVIFSTASAQVSEVTIISVRCNLAHFVGKIGTDAPYVQVQVARIDDLSEVLAEKVVNVRSDGQFTVAMNYPRQAENSYLLFTIGEWDGQEYLDIPVPLDYYCNQFGGNSSAEPTPAPTPEG